MGEEQKVNHPFSSSLEFHCRGIEKPTSTEFQFSVDNARWVQRHDRGQVEEKERGWRLQGE